jgi:hypothetical protein
MIGGNGLLTRARGRLYIAFVAQFALLDLLVRGPRGYARHPVAAVGALVSLALWTLASSLATRRAWRLVLALLAAAVLVVDSFVYRYYRTLLDIQVVGSALYDWADARPIIVKLLPVAAGLTAVACAVEYACLSGPVPQTTRRSRVATGLALLLGLALTPVRSLTPELRAAQSCALLWTTRQARTGTAQAIPVLPSARDDVPSILLVLTESVRASSYCTDPRGRCAFSPEVDALFPGRVPLRQLRSVASYTILSVSALLTGRAPAEAGETIAEAPTLFDFVHASRIDGRAPWVGYWSAQAASVLGRDVRASVDSAITLETLLGRSLADEDDAVEQDIDRQLVDRCIQELPKVRRPFFLVLHLLGTHAPYFVDPARAPFQPTQQVVTWAGLPDLLNAYHDAIVAQDHALATCLRAFVQQQGSSPWIVVFTSDHGEAFGEHGAIHHGQNLYDEQVHVPGWVAASEGALDAAQRENLARHQDAFVTHLDIVPTVLDLLGVLDGMAMAPMRPRLAGHSLIAPLTTAPPIPMTNCTPLFPCPLNTWGMQGQAHALVAQPWDGDWNCVDLETHRERTNDPACAVLREASRRYFRTLPSGQAN